jgi:hypothetical protein
MHHHHQIHHHTDKLFYFIKREHDGAWLPAVTRLRATANAITQYSAAGNFAVCQDVINLPASGNKSGRRE